MINSTRANHLSLDFKNAYWYIASFCHGCNKRTGEIELKKNTILMILNKTNLVSKQNLSSSSSIFDLFHMPSMLFR